MSISAYKEITEWEDSDGILCNHTYLFDGKSNALAYAKQSSNDITVFKKPLPINTSRRKFIKVVHPGLEEIARNFVVQEKPNNHPFWKVKSDSGKEYMVELIGGNYHCNCKGYQFRGKCKHSDSVKAEQK
jgi:hypothetical protein